MKKEATLSRVRLKTPRAAAISGILFSVLLITGLLLLRLSVRADPLETGTWLKISSNKVALALNLGYLPEFMVHRRTARPPGRARRSLLCHSLSRQRAFVPRHAVRLGRRGGRNHHGLIPPGPKGCSTRRCSPSPVERGHCPLVLPRTGSQETHMFCAVTCAPPEL